MELEFIPKTLALIPDGNRRWARKNGFSVLEGYNNGVKKFIDFSEWCMDYGINNVTVWALSSDNLKRSKDEVNTLLGIYRKVSNDRSLIKRLHKNEARVNIIGNTALLPKDLLDSLHKIEVETRCYTKKAINMLIGYGGRDDLLAAARYFTKLHDASKINAERFWKSLLSSAVPDLDLVIRTSGEMRLSGFMPWQTSYSEFYFSDKLWPDFTRRDLHLALVDYSNRERRFGR
jgi:undecaprenyl diphosphate synthase